MIVNTWRLCLNSWSLDSRMGESFVKNSQKKSLLYTPPTGTHTHHTVNTFHSNHQQHRADQMRAEQQDSHTSQQKHCFYLKPHVFGSQWDVTKEWTHCSESQTVSLPPTLSSHPLTCVCRHLGPHQNKNTAGQGTMCECAVALDQAESIFGRALQSPSFKHVWVTA